MISHAFPSTFPEAFPICKAVVNYRKAFIQTANNQLSWNITSYFVLYEVTVAFLELASACRPLDKHCLNESIPHVQ